MSVMAILILGLSFLYMNIEEKVNVVLPTEEPSVNETLVQANSVSGGAVQLSFPFQVFELAAGDITADRVVLAISTSTLKVGAPTGLIVYDLVTSTILDTLPINLQDNIHDGIMYRDTLFWVQTYAGDVGVDAHPIGVYMYDLKRRVLNEITPKYQYLNENTPGTLTLARSVDGTPILTLNSHLDTVPGSLDTLQSSFSWDPTAKQFQFLNSKLLPNQRSGFRGESRRSTDELTSTIADSLDHEYYSNKGVQRVYYSSGPTYRNSESEAVLQRDLSLTLLSERLQAWLQNRDPHGSQYCFLSTEYRACYAFTKNFAVGMYSRDGNSGDSFYLIELE